MEVVRAGTTAARLCAAVLILGLTACSGGSASGDGETISAQPGELFTVTIDDTDEIGPDFVLRGDGGRPLFVLTPAFGSESPTFEPVEDGVIVRRPAAMILETDELEFVLPPGLDPGSYELCAQNDECHNVTVPNQ